MLRRAELGGRRDDEQTIVGEGLRYSLWANSLAQKRIIDKVSKGATLIISAWREKKYKTQEFTGDLKYIYNVYFANLTV